MITENDIKGEVIKLNEASKKYNRNYEHRKGNDDSWALFDVQNNSYKPVYYSTTSAGLFAYVSLLKNLYLEGKIPQ